MLGLALWSVALAGWVWPSSAPPLRYTEAEVQFLWTAPVSRRQLLGYKLLRAQVGLLVGVVVASVFSGAWTSPSGRLFLLLGGWLVFATLWLHRLGIALTKAALRRPWRAVPWQAWTALAVMGTLSATLVTALVSRVREWMTLGVEPTALLSALSAFGTRGIGAVALWPFRAIVGPVFAPSVPAFAMAIGPAVGLLLFNYVWVLELDAAVRLEVTAAERPVAMPRRRKTGPVIRRVPFDLRPEGRPEVAILWKNLILLGRHASGRTVIRILLPVVALAAVLGTSRQGLLVVPFLVLLFAVLALTGPYMVRNDLRQDLPRLALLKTWPIPGWSLLLGEILAPAVALSVAIWSTLAVAFALSARLSFPAFGLADRAVLAVVAALAAPMLVVGQLVVQNAAAVLFPWWVATGPSRPRGIEAMGQNLLMFAATLVALALGLVPALLVSGAVGWVGYQLVGRAGFLAAGALFALMLVVETGAAIAWLGGVLERTDPTDVEGASA